MRFEPLTDTLKDCRRSMVENDALMTLGEAKLTMIVATGVLVSQQLAHVVVIILGSRRQKEKSPGTRTTIFFPSRNDNVTATSRSI